MAIETVVLTTTENLAQQLKQCQSWTEIESLITLAPDSKGDAWELLDEQEKTRIKELKQASVLPELEVGDFVLWADCPGSLQIFNPFRCREINADGIWLDWIYHPVARHRLVKVMPD